MDSGVRACAFVRVAFHKPLHTRTYGGARIDSSLYAGCAERDQHKLALDADVRILQRPSTALQHLYPALQRFQCHASQPACGWQECLPAASPLPLGAVGFEYTRGG